MPEADDIEARFRTAGHFTEALKPGRFTLFCQPIVPVASPAIDCKYLEIFVRFREEEDKLIPPGTFSPVLEANHLTQGLQGCRRADREARRNRIKSSR